MDIELDSSEVSRRVLAENEAKDFLQQYGISTTQYTVVSHEEELEGLAFPVAVKVCSPRILHKTDVGGVRLDVNNPDELRRVRTEFAERFPEERLLVEPMAERGVELIVGLLHDDTFGMAIMVGAGGIYTELYEDVSFRIVPISARDADKMLTDLRGHAVLEGYRGARVDRDAVVDLLVKISRLGEDYRGRIDQMDLNPVYVYAQGYCVVDAKLILRNMPEGTNGRYE